MSDGRAQPGSTQATANRQTSASASPTSLQNWQAVWNRKGADPAVNLRGESLLSQLLVVDGFTSAFGHMGDTQIWLDYVAAQARRLDVCPGDTLFEVGCGGGAFLYPFWSAGHAVAGCDYAANLVTIAQQAMPDAKLHIAEAIELPAAARADVVVSNGVFLYFPSEAYAALVLRKMVAMAQKSLGIFDVCDLARRDEAIAARKAVLGEAEYAERYRGLDQLYLERAWFGHILADLPVRVEVDDQAMQGYGNAAYRFNVYIHRM